MIITAARVKKLASMVVSNTRELVLQIFRHSKSRLTSTQPLNSSTTTGTVPQINGVPYEQLKLVNKSELQELLKKSKVDFGTHHREFYETSTVMQGNIIVITEYNQLTLTKSVKEFKRVGLRKWELHGTFIMYNEKARTYDTKIDEPLIDSLELILSKYITIVVNKDVLGL